MAHLTVRSMPPPTGASLVNLTNLERGLLTDLERHAVPAASLAIMKDGRLIAARGYGFTITTDASRRRDGVTYVGF